MAVTFDTNILLSATLWDGSVSQKLLFKLIGEDVKVYSSMEILAEYQKVLQRDFDYTDEDASEIMAKVLSFASLVTPTMKVSIIKDDPDDNKIVECAIASSSEYIITYDKHLLKVGEYEGVKIITPENALRIFKN